MLAHIAELEAKVQGILDQACSWRLVDASSLDAGLPLINTLRNCAIRADEAKYPRGAQRLRWAVHSVEERFGARSA